MTGRKVLGVLGLILLATAVVPPATAWAVNRSRLRRASVDVVRIADALHQAERELPAAMRGAVLCGPGRMPLTAIPAAERWVTMPRAALAGAIGDRSVLSADPWGNCYVVNLAAAADGATTTLWVLSAGPNGIIDTPFVASEAPAGDDVGVRVR